MSVGQPFSASLGSCPLPWSRYEHIVLGHGGGGQLTAELIERLFLPELDNPVLAAQEDQAILAWPVSLNVAARLAFSADAYVVRPPFFPGGDIGSLAVHGTVNDLAVGGARPLYLSAAFILEEGLLLADLQRIVASMGRACAACGVTLVAADTKVVDRGKGDQVFITTSGIGLVPDGLNLSIHKARPGDAILVSGTLGDHGVAILSVREGLEFETALESDSAPLHDLTRVMLEVCPTIRCMRDPTRGGLASVLHELALASRVGVQIRERALPVRPAVRAACEMLGLDVLHVASEGKLMAVVPAADADRLLEAMRCHPLGRESAVVGEVVAEHAGTVVMESLAGGKRIVSRLSGEQLPRIC
jgi:hydrogenase expression/formation protein HypE